MGAQDGREKIGKEGAIGGASTAVVCFFQAFYIGFYKGGQHIFGRAYVYKKERGEVWDEDGRAVCGPCFFFPGSFIPFLVFEIPRERHGTHHQARRRERMEGGSERRCVRETVVWHATACLSGATAGRDANPPVARHRLVIYLRPGSEYHARSSLHYRISDLLVIPFRGQRWWGPPMTWPDVKWHSASFRDRSSHVSARDLRRSACWWSRSRQSGWPVGCWGPDYWIWQVMLTRV